MVQEHFPDLVAAASRCRSLVLELVVWDQQAGRLSFGELQRRAAAHGRSARARNGLLHRLRHPRAGRHPAAQLPPATPHPARSPRPPHTVRRPLDAVPDDDLPGQGDGVAGVLNRPRPRRAAHGSNCPQPRSDRPKRPPVGAFRSGRSPGCGPSFTAWSSTNSELVASFTSTDSACTWVPAAFSDHRHSGCSR